MYLCRKCPENSYKPLKFTINQRLHKITVFAIKPQINKTPYKYTTPLDKGTIKELELKRR